MTLHLGTPWCSTNELLGVIDQSSWAKYHRCPSVHKSLAAARTSNNLSFYGDIERWWNKAGIEVTLSLPRAAPFPTVS